MPYYVCILFFQGIRINNLNKFLNSQINNNLIFNTLPKTCYKTYILIAKKATKTFVVSILATIFAALFKPNSDIVQ